MQTLANIPRTKMAPGTTLKNESSLFFEIHFGLVSFCKQRCPFDKLVNMTDVRLGPPVSTVTQSSFRGAYPAIKVSKMKAVFIFGIIRRMLVLWFIDQDNILTLE